MLSTDWLTDSLIRSAGIVGTWAMRRANSTVRLADGDLAQVAPAAGVLEEVVPLLEHQPFGALPVCPGVGHRRVLVGAGHELFHRCLRPEVVAGGEHRARPAEDHDAHVVIGL